ncbi:hypothetical protein P7C70_g7609, partial [Phenoliferia sp. Uapishka_3]
PPPQRSPSPGQYDADGNGDDGWEADHEAFAQAQAVQDAEQADFERQQQVGEELDAEYDREARAEIELDELIDGYRACITQNYGAGGGEALCIRLDPYVWVLEDWDDYTKVYTSTGVVVRIVETQACICRRRHKFTIGPDLVENGVFNLNNRSLFTHELFANLFTQLNTSATPLASFRLNIHRSYSNNPNGLPFPSPRAFNNVFYIVEKLYVLDTPEHCVECGQFPSTLICDGVANCISNRNITASLCPPTVPPPAGRQPIVEDVAPSRNRPFLAQAPLRRRLIAALEQAGSIEEVDEEEGGEEVNVVSLQAVVGELKELPAGRYRAEAALAPLLLELANLTITDRRPLYSLYIAFLLQVAAHEPVLQLAPVALAPSLLRFGTPGPHLAEHDKDDIRWFASRCPSLARVLLFHTTHQLPVPLSLRSLIFEIGNSVQSNFDRIATHATPAVDLALDDNRPSWRETGSSYLMPKIRTRPLYSKFAGDGGVASRAEKKREGDIPPCTKLYNTYTKASQSGGVMALWCTHSINYGFHFIPRGEGRNDVFSAIFSHWPTAPKIIVYDFACALAGYCMSREAHYWKETLFVIDQLHQRDHRKCSNACYLETYMSTDPTLKYVNSSAAECGNNGLGRIRLSMSYMTQEHAVALCRLFTNVWNRVKIIKMASSRAQKDARRARGRV